MRDSEWKGLGRFLIQVGWQGPVVSDPSCITWRAKFRDPEITYEAYEDGVIVASTDVICGESETPVFGTSAMSSKVVSIQSESLKSIKTVKLAEPSLSGLLLSQNNLTEYNYIIQNMPLLLLEVTSFDKNADLVKPQKSKVDILLFSQLDIKLTKPRNS